MNAAASVPYAIRPFDPARDYQAQADIYIRSEVGQAEGPELLRHYDDTKDTGMLDLRLVAELGGRVGGVAEYFQNPGMYHPRKFQLRLAVLPELRRRGVGAALFDALVSRLAEHDPLTLRAQAKENCEDGLRFAAARGFDEEKRDWESSLDVAAFDPAPYAGLAARLAEQGIAITNLHQLASDPGMPRKFYELFSTARLDVPRHEPATPVPFEKFFEWTFEALDYSPEGSIVALDGAKYVGMSQLWRSDESPDVFTGLTAVLREYRGRGLALAMKLAGIAYAKRIGAPTLHTDNDSTNVQMLRINDKLGFVRKPALITFRKDMEGARGP